MLMSNLFYHKEITDAQWNKIKFLFPKKKVRRPPLDPRTVFNAILWILSSGARWQLCADKSSNRSVAWRPKSTSLIEEAIRDYLEKRGALVCKHTFDADLYKRRNLVERFFQRIKNFRRIATRFDKLALCFLNFVLLASVVILF